MFSDLNYQEVIFSTLCEKMETIMLKYHSEAVWQPKKDVGSGRETNNH